MFFFIHKIFFGSFSNILIIAENLFFLVLNFNSLFLFLC